MLQSRSLPEPDHHLAYRLHWTGVIRSWEAYRRRKVLEAVLARAAAGDFIPTAWERRFIVPELDDQPHAGASLLSLVEVLQAYAKEESKAEPGDDTPPA